ASLLRGVAAVDDLATARALIAELPELEAVTRDGDLLGRERAYGGSTSAPSLLEVQAAVDEAADQLAAATGRAEQLARKLAEAAAVESAALAKLHESDAERSAVAEQLGRLGTAARTAAEEVEKLAAAEAEARQALEQDRLALAEMEERVDAAEEAGDDDAEPPTEERDRLLHVARQARQAETEAR